MGTEDCKIARCGDGFVQEGVEQCDDGNNENGDGCSSSCQVEDAATGCSENEILVDWRFRTDGYGSETSWELVSGDGEVIEGGSGYENNQEFEFNICVPAAGCYTLR